MPFITSCYADNRFRDLGEEENQSDLNFSKTNTNTPPITFSAQTKTNPSEFYISFFINEIDASGRCSQP